MLRLFFIVHICVYIYIHMCVYLYTYVCTLTYMYIYIHICTYTQVYIHTHTCNIYTYMSIYTHYIYFHKSYDRDIVINKLRLFPVACTCVRLKHQTVTLQNYRPACSGTSSSTDYKRHPESACHPLNALFDWC